MKTDEIQNQEYTITIDSDETIVNGWNKEYQEIKDHLNVVWRETCSITEANKEFSRIINEQANKYHSRQIDKFYTIRLYDSKGKQIKQES